MKNNILKKVFCLATGLSMSILSLSVHSNVASAQVLSNQVSAKFKTVELNPGEVGDVGSKCDIDVSGSFQYIVNALKNTTKFSMSMKDKDKTIAEKSFTGNGVLNLDANKYEDIVFGIKNEGQESDTFDSGYVATGENPNVNCNSGAFNILTPLATILCGLLLLF